MKPSDRPRPAPRQTARERLIYVDTSVRTAAIGRRLTSAHAAAQAGADVLDVGYPAASADAFELVRQCAREIQRPTVLRAFARCNPVDVDAAFGALETAGAPRILVAPEATLASDPAYLRRIRYAVEHARALCDDVEIAVEGAWRMPPEQLLAAVSTAVAAGARTVTLPDAAGIASLLDVRRAFADVAGVLPDEVALGCDTPSLRATSAAVQAGARQITGEREQVTALVVASRWLSDGCPSQPAAS